MTRSTLDNGMCASHSHDVAPTAHGLVICTGCRHWVDPSVCGCGETIGNGRAHDNHSPIPIGCQCYRNAGGRI